MANSLSDQSKKPPHSLESPVKMLIITLRSHIKADLHSSMKVLTPHKLSSKKRPSKLTLAFLNSE